MRHFIRRCSLVLGGIALISLLGSCMSIASLVGVGNREGTLEEFAKRDTYHKFPKSVGSDAKMEKLAMEMITKWFMDSGDYPVDVLKLSNQSSDWQVHRNDWGDIDSKYWTFYVLCKTKEETKYTVEGDYFGSTVYTFPKGSYCYTYMHLNCQSLGGGSFGKPVVVFPDLQNKKLSDFFMLVDADGKAALGK